MIILFDSIFGHGRMIVFHLIEWITTDTKPLTKVSEGWKNRSTFSVPAILTRHEVTCMSAVQEDEYDQVCRRIQDN